MWYNTTTHEVNYDSTLSISYIAPMGEIYLLSNANVTTITTQNVYTLVATGTWTNGYLFNFSQPTDGYLTYTNANSGHAHLGCTLSVSSPSANQLVKSILVKNATVNVNNEYTGGTLLTNGVIKFKLGAGNDISSSAIHSMTHLAQNDTISLFIMNETSTANFTVTEANLFAMIPLLPI